MTELDKASNEMWEPVPLVDIDTEKDMPSSMTYWQELWKNLRRNKLSLIGLSLIIFILILSIVGPVITDISYSDQNLLRSNEGPSQEHWFGTDNHGRDIFERVLYGGRVSLTVAFVATIVQLFIGVLYGGISGYVGGHVDNIMMRIVDIINTVPLILYTILLMVVIGSGFKSVIIAIGTVYWVGMARIMRGQVLSLKERDYIMAARALGASNGRILLKHLIPNAMGSIIVTTTMTIPGAIFTESFLSFIGLGISAPMASWGSLVSDALPSFRAYPYQLFLPSIAICITMLGFNFLGEGLRDAIDPLAIRLD